MFPKRLSCQSGFLVPLSLFIVVGAASLAVAMSQMAAGSRSSAVLSSLNAQAFFAADAGIQRAMHQIHFNNDEQALSDSACSSLDGSSLTLTVVGLKGCGVALSCRVEQSSDGAVSLYTVISQSTCGQGSLTTGRRIRSQTYMFDS